MSKKPESLKQKRLIRVKAYFTACGSWKSKIPSFALRALAKSASCRARASKSRNLIRSELRG